MRDPCRSRSVKVVRHERITDNAKGWFAGPWDSNLAISIGFANEGVDEPHVHSQVTEIYLVARGLFCPRR